MGDTEKKQEYNLQKIRDAFNEVLEAYVQSDGDKKLGIVRGAPLARLDTLVHVLERAGEYQKRIGMPYDPQKLRWFNAIVAQVGSIAGRLNPLGGEHTGTTIEDDIARLAAMCITFLEMSRYRSRFGKLDKENVDG